MYKYLNKSKAIQEFNEYENSRLIEVDKLNSFYKKIREDLLNFHEEYKHFIDTRKVYEYDLSMALEIYEYFDLRTYGYSNLSNYDFWRYICIKVVPDIIEERHGLNPEYYYKKNVRIYIPTLWWYIHMTWQGSHEETRKILNKHNTDTIQSLVERPGKQGAYLETYRKIISYYDKLDQKDKRYGTTGRNYLLRTLMVMHTAKCLLINPDLVGVDQYVRNIYENVGIKFNKVGTSYEYIRGN